jgi:hypothetical protein
MKVLFVHHRGCNVMYLTDCLKYLRDKRLIRCRMVDLEDFANGAPGDHDVLIYQTFPGEGHPTKYEPELIKRTDRRFLDFPSYKILFDAHASGSTDGFSRFRDRTIPRIKNAPHADFLKRYNVICTTTYPIKMQSVPAQERDVDVSYCVNIRCNPLREKILGLLKGYERKARMEFSGRRKYSEEEYLMHLGRVRISVNAPGYGEGTFRHLETLASGSLMFAHESINEIRLLPNAELVDGRDYVSFSLKDMLKKLDYLLDNPAIVGKISENGHKKFIEGYSIGKTALSLYKTITD